MSDSEAGFLIGLAIIVVVSFIGYIGSQILFYKSLTPEEAKALEERREYPHSSKVQILALINVTCQFTLFLNSAILVAVVLKEYL